MLLKLVGNIWRSFEIQLINWKVKLKHRWTKHYLLSAVGAANNDDTSSNKITSFIKDTKLYALVVTLSTKDNQKLPKLQSKKFKKWDYLNEFKINSENKNTANEYRHFHKSNRLALGNQRFPVRVQLPAMCRGSSLQ